MQHSPLQGSKADGTVGHPKLVMHPEHMKDFMLWRAFKSGDERALITIFDRFTKPMYNYGYKLVGDRELVRDVVQEFFIELWSKRAHLGDTDCIKSYLFKSLRRKLMRLKLRSERRFFEYLVQPLEEGCYPSHEVVLIAEQTSKEREQQVREMLSKLTRRQQEALFLRYIEELSCDEVAAIMKLSKQAVYNLIHHALKGLKETKSGE